MNMNKKFSIVLCIATLLFVTQLEAQLYVGVEGGANRNYLITNTSDKPFFTYEPLYGYSVGIPIRYEFPSFAMVWWYPGCPQLCSKELSHAAHRLLFADVRAVSITTISNCLLWHNSGLAAISIKNKVFMVLLNLGGFGGYWMSGHVKGRALSPMDLTNYQEFDETYTFSS